MSKKYVGIIVVCMLALTLGLVGCGQQSQTAKGKALKVGTDASFAPFEFQDEKSKEYTGFDMDLAKALGKQMGYEVEVQNISFDGLIPALDAGNIDMIAAGMSITPERSEKVTFSKAYYKSGLSILVKKNNETIKNFKDLEGKRIAVQIGTTSAQEAKKIKDATVREFNTAPEAIMELKAGGVDAVVNDLPVNDYYLAQGGSAENKLIGEVVSSEEYGLAIAKKNTELAEKVNKALEEIKANGELDKIHMKWFNKKPQ